MALPNFETNWKDYLSPINSMIKVDKGIFLGIVRKLGFFKKYVTGTAHLENSLEYQKILLPRSIWWSKF
jgi:hypothetical protein